MKYIVLVALARFNKIGEKYLEKSTMYLQNGDRRENVRVRVEKQFKASDTLDGILARAPMCM